MKNKKSSDLRILLPILFAMFCSTLQGQGVPIKSSLYSQNAWFIDVSNPNGLNQWLPKVKASGVRYCRIGGIGPNFKPIYSWNPSTFAVSGGDVGNLKNLIDSLRFYNVEPIIQVGYNPVCTNTAVSTLADVSRANQAVIAGNVVSQLKTI